MNEELVGVDSVWASVGIRCRGSFWREERPRGSARLLSFPWISSAAHLRRRREKFACLEQSSMVSLKHPLSSLTTFARKREQRKRPQSALDREGESSRPVDERERRETLTGLIPLFPFPPTEAFLPRGCRTSMVVGRSGIKSGTAAAEGGKNDWVAVTGVGRGVGPPC